MGTSKKVIENTDELSDDEIANEMSDDSDDSSLDSDESDDSDSSGDDLNTTQDTEDNAEGGEEEEDELIKAIRRENERIRDHPPTINCEDWISDIAFHPVEDILSVGLVTGDVLCYKYTNDENTLVNQLELHTEACRDIEFSADGKVLFSSSKDRTIMLSDSATGKLIRFYENAHDDAIYCLHVLNEHLIATGDDNGVVKVWDIRDRHDRTIFKLKKNTDYISDLASNEDCKYLLCSSGDGSLTSIDMQQRKFLVQSEEYDEELTCLGLFKHETKLLAGSSKGKLLLFNWHEFGLHSDLFPGPKTQINAMVPITENIVVTACEDGNLRATHLFPHKQLGIVGQHDLSVENVDICNNGKFIASTCNNNHIKFWNIQYFEDFEEITHNKDSKNKKREVDFNLPSSKRQNVADFFSDLC